MIPMASDFEKEMIRKIFVGLMIIVVGLGVIGVRAGNARQECRLEALKADKTADEIIRICS